MDSDTYMPIKYPSETCAPPDRRQTQATGGGGGGLSRGKETIYGQFSEGYKAGMMIPVPLTDIEV